MTAWGLRRGRAALVQGRGNSPVLVLRQAWPKSRSGVQPCSPCSRAGRVGWLAGCPAGRPAWLERSGWSGLLEATGNPRHA